MTNMNRLAKLDDESREGLNSDKIAFALTLPFQPRHTETYADLKKFEDLDVKDIHRRTSGLILDVDGTLVPHHGEVFADPVVEKLREIRAQMKVCIFSNNNQERPIFEQLGIPVVKHAAPKPSPWGFERAARDYLKLSPRACTMIGDNLLTDGGARLAGMRLILVDPIPGPENFFHKLTRSYARSVKSMHDKLYGRTNRPPRLTA